MKKISTSNISTIKKDLAALYKTVYQGNGTPSIINQITKLNEQVKSLEQKMDTKLESFETEMSLKFKNITDVVTEKIANLSDQINREFTSEKQVIDNRWNHKTAITTAVLASFTSFFVVFLTEVLKRFH